MLPHVDDFLLSLQASKYSPETIYNYERDLNVFSDFLSESNIDFTNVDKRAITYFKAYLVSRDRKTANQTRPSEKQLDSRSINRMLSALRGYLRYLIDIDYPCPVPPEAVKLTKAGKKHPQVAELEDLVRLVEAPNSLESNLKTALRNRAMLEVLFATGMRISELCNLNRSQIDATGRIFITGKGRKQRFSTNYLQDRIKRYREKLRINVPTSAHSLRHGFATYLAEEGANPAALQILLGHESLDTTTRYVHASDKYAEETHRKYHPLARPG
jgi:integrase/recombinase XerD